MTNGIESAQSNSKTNKQPPVFFSGYKRFDELVGGFRPGELSCFSDRIVMGADDLCLNIARNIALSTCSQVPVFSMLPTPLVLYRKLAAIERLVPFFVSVDGQFPIFDIADWRALLSDANRSSSRYLCFDPVPELTPQSLCKLTLTQVEEACWRFQDNGGLGLIVFDYWSHYSLTESSIKLEDLVPTLKSIAHSYQVPVFMLAPVGRDIEYRENKRPQLEDFEKAVGFLEYFDNVFFAYRDCVYNEYCSEPDVMELIVGKSRSLKTGTVKFRYDRNHCSFQEA